MNQKKAKEMRRIAREQTIGQYVHRTRQLYRDLKTQAKKAAQPAPGKAPTRRASRPADGYKLLKKASQYRPQGLIGQNPRREWTPGPLIIAKGLHDNPRRNVGVRYPGYQSKAQRTRAAGRGFFG